MKTTLLTLLALLTLALLGLAQAPSAAAPKASASEKARRTASQSNLKQIGLALTLYLETHNQRMPDADRWTDEIMPYVRNQNLFHDPSAPASQKWSYAFNRSLSRVPLMRLQSPATTVMLFESRKGVKNASDNGQSVPRPGRHSGGTDYAFTDTHVRWFADGTKPSYLLSGR